MTPAQSRGAACSDESAIGDLDYVAGGSLGIFGISAIHHDARDALTHAQILVAFTAKLALPACPLYPRHADPVSDLDTFSHALHRGAPLHHAAYNLVPQNQGLLYDAGQLLPVAVSHVQIGMTDTANLHLDQDFVYANFRARYFLHC